MIRSKPARLAFVCAFVMSITAAHAQSVTLVALAPVPEPGTFALVGLTAVTIGGGCWLRRRRPTRDAA